jgi:hypothetical protein
MAGARFLTYVSKGRIFFKKYFDQCTLTLSGLVEVYYLKKNKTFQGWHTFLQGKKLFCELIQSLNNFLWGMFLKCLSIHTQSIM